MSITSRNKKAETLAWITANEAEFWTSTSPIAKHNTSNNFPLINHNSSNVILSPDGLYFKTNNEINTVMEDHLSLLHEETIEQQEKESKKQEENNNRPVIFPSNENSQQNNNNSQKNMSLIDRLFLQITRSSISETDYIDDEVFAEVDETQIKSAVSNDYVNADKLVQDKNVPKNDISLLNAIKSFIDEVGEETNVILGVMDEESLLNRRSRKVKSIVPLIKAD